VERGCRHQNGQARSRVRSGGTKLSHCVLIHRAVRSTRAACKLQRGLKSRSQRALDGRAASRHESGACIRDEISGECVSLGRRVSIASLDVGDEGNSRTMHADRHLAGQSEARLYAGEVSLRSAGVPKESQTLEDVVCARKGCVGTRKDANENHLGLLLSILHRSASAEHLSSSFSRSLSPVEALASFPRHSCRERRRRDRKSKVTNLVTFPSVLENPQVPFADHGGR
jgi:hypothetical protein